MNAKLQIICFLSVALLTGCSSGGGSVTVYTSQDQVYAEPILEQFEREAGVRVRAVYDSEAVKTVGLVNRLIAEKAIHVAICSGIMRHFAHINLPSLVCLMLTRRLSRLVLGLGSGCGTRTASVALICRLAWLH